MKIDFESYLQCENCNTVYITLDDMKNYNRNGVERVAQQTNKKCCSNISLLWWHDGIQPKDIRIKYKVEQLTLDDGDLESVFRITWYNLNKRRVIL